MPSTADQKPEFLPRDPQLRDEPAPRRRVRLGRPMALALLACEVVVLVLVAVGLPHAQLVLAIVEPCVLALAIGVSAVLWRRRRAYLRQGLSGGTALVRALGDVLPARLVRVLTGEARIFVTLARWITHARPSDSGAVPISYGRGLRPLLLALVPLSVMEIGAVDLLLRHYAIHWVIAGISAYGALWLIGLAGSTRVRPHTLNGNRLTLRLLVFDQLELDLSALERVAVVRVSGQKRSVHLDDGVLTLSVMGATNVQLTFREPILVTGDREFIAKQIQFEADEPDLTVRLLEGLSAVPTSAVRGIFSEFGI